jgi:maleylpyruvate isomerase
MMSWSCTDPSSLRLFLDLFYRLKYRFQTLSRATDNGLIDRSPTAALASRCPVARMAPMPDSQPLELITEATHRLVRAVDELSDDDLRADSLLPEWSRAHVVAHLALNAEGLACALVGVREHRSVPMYASQEDRDRDIEELAAQEASALRERFLAGTTLVGEELAELPDNLAGARIDRTPGGRTFAAGAVPGMRLREVEIHHVDLDSGYSRADWPAAFGESLVAQLVDRADASGPFTAYAVDADRTFQRGDGGPRVVGTAADLGWWLTGRGNGDGLTSEGGELPQIGAW